jgi:dihydroneopterin aldolase
VIVELAALRLYGHHGANPEEREEGQWFLFDVWVEVGDAGSSDRIEDAVDYRKIAAAVQEVSDGTQFHLLEALGTAVVDALLDRFEIDWARVRVRKPDVALPVEYSAVTVERRR